MTPDEIQLLQHVGEVQITNFYFYGVNVGLYGFYLAISFFGTRVLLTQRKSKACWILLCCILLLFVLNTAGLVLLTISNIFLIRGALISNPDQPLDVRLELADASVFALAVSQSWLNNSAGFQYIIGDAIVVWRAWAIWYESKVVKVILSVVTALSIASVFASGTVSTIYWVTTGSEQVSTSSAPMILIILAQSMSLATNVVATALIGYKAYRYRDMLRKSGRTKSTASTVLFFLTESGMIYCVMQVIFIALNVLNSNPLSTLDTAAAIWQFVLTFASSIYPVLVILIVKQHRSIADQTGMMPTGGAMADSKYSPDKSGDGLEIETHVSFARPPAGSNTTSSGLASEACLSFANSEQDKPVPVIGDVEKSAGLVNAKI